MFAGPNGSGKSTIKATFEKKYKNLLGIFVNPDEIEAQIKKRGFLDLRNITFKPIGMKF
jgi:predicted ABC-type ATPase